MARGIVTALSKTAATATVALATAAVVFTAHRLLPRHVSQSEPDPGPAPAERLPSDPAATHREERNVAPRTEAAAAPPEEESAAADRSGGPAADPAALQPEAPASFLDTSLLMAVRDAGYVCPGLFAAEQGADGLIAWRVVCDGALVYFVGVDEAGSAVVDPVPYGEGLQYFDPDAPPLWLEQPGQPPRPIEPRLPR